MCFNTPDMNFNILVLRVFLIRMVNTGEQEISDLETESPEMPLDGPLFTGKDNISLIVEKKIRGQVEGCFGYLSGNIYLTRSLLHVFPTKPNKYMEYKLSPW
ncbi:hypothetical protein PPYR_05443 [Photinus pyralis]|uniref:Uncharacterized protein n=1 Tax=Photinus pyralis TaxID=7054 RepID=A0A5N4AUU7_PHOPY|nr:hypothetical protein PPYR_05443 [Photinus pyralis]